MGAHTHTKHSCPIYCRRIDKTPTKIKLSTKLDFLYKGQDPAGKRIEVSHMF